MVSQRVLSAPRLPIAPDRHLVQKTGADPASPDWESSVLPLNDFCMVSQRGFEPLPEALEELPSVRWLTGTKLVSQAGFEPTLNRF